MKVFDVAQKKAALSARRALAIESARIGVAAHRRAADAQQNRGFVQRKLRVAQALEQLFGRFGLEAHALFWRVIAATAFWRFRFAFDDGLALSRRLNRLVFGRGERNHARILSRVRRLRSRLRNRNGRRG